MSDEQEILESVAAAKAPGTFNIVNVLQERAYPKTQVKIVLDEATIYEIAGVQEEIESIQSKVGKGGASETQRVRLEELDASYQELSAKIMSSQYTVYLMGISEGKREELYREAVKKYPIQYETNNDISSLLNSNNGRTEKPSAERDALFTDDLWKEQIEKIENPDGEEQVQFSYTDVKAMRNSFPLSAIMKINEAIDKLRASTALFVMETNEDFLAKP